MELTTLLLLLGVLSIGGYHVGRSQSLRLVGGPALAPNLHSRPRYYGYFLALRCALPALALVVLWIALDDIVVVAAVVESMASTTADLSRGEVDLLINTVRNVASGGVETAAVGPEVRRAAEHYIALHAQSRQLLVIAVVAVAVGSASYAFRRISPAFRARNSVERLLTRGLIIASSIALLTTLGIVMSVLFEAIRFFREVPVSDFLFGLEWSPQTAIRSDQVGSSGNFGAVPLFAGTLLITLVAMLVALPIGLMTAIYLSEYASRRVRGLAKPLLEVLAGIPTVVYGFFAAVTLAPIIRDVGESAGFSVAAESALAAGLVMGIMILPLISSMAEDALSAVPRTLRDASLAVGATRSETVVRVMMPAAVPGIAGGVLLAVSRAIGETMIVVMAAGLAANLTANPFAAVTTVTVQIVTLLVGDQEFATAKTLAAFALGLVLFVVTLILNVLGLRIVRRYQERYS
ncbi:MAG: phosphate ABC transporter permease subunit PstC [Pseudomonadota bacterium]